VAVATLNIVSSGQTRLAEYIAARIAASISSSNGRRNAASASATS